MRRRGLCGDKPILGCVWEMNLVSFEANAWGAAVLNQGGTPSEWLALDLAQRCAG